MTFLLAVQDREEVEPASVQYREEVEPASVQYREAEPAWNLCQQLGRTVGRQPAVILQL